MLEADLIHVEVGEGYELAIRLSCISAVKKMKNVLFVSVLGEEQPIQLRGTAAESVWKLIRTNSLSLPKSVERSA